MRICILISLLLQNKTTAFHLAAKGGHLSCLRLLFAAAEERRLLESLPRVDKVNYLSSLCVYWASHDPVEWMESGMSR